jgi:hypothetical protein
MKFTKEGSGRSAIYTSDDGNITVKFGFVGDWKGFYSNKGEDNTKYLAWYIWVKDQNRKLPKYYKTYQKAVDAAQKFIQKQKMKTEDKQKMSKKITLTEKKLRKMVKDIVKEYGGVFGGSKTEKLTSDILGHIKSTLDPEDKTIRNEVLKKLLSKINEEV